MNEQRLSVRLVSVWNKLAELNPPPMFAQFNKNNVSDVWQQCAVLQIDPSASGDDNYHITVEFMGEVANKLLPDFTNGKRFSTKSMSMQAKKYLKNISDVVNNVQTIINDGSVVGHNNKMVKYRVCLLPFTDKNAKVAYIVVGFSWIEC